MEAVQKDEFLQTEDEKLFAEFTKISKPLEDPPRLKGDTKLDASSAFCDMSDDDKLMAEFAKVRFDPVTVTISLCN